MHDFLQKIIARHPELAQYIQVSELLLEDIYQSATVGTHFRKSLSKVKIVRRTTNPPDKIPWDDKEKIALLYAQMHHFSKKTPDERIIFCFFDNLLDRILNKQLLFYSANQHHIPENTVLNLILLNSVCNSRIHPHKIQGSGLIDYDYRENVITFLTSNEKSLKKTCRAAIKKNDIGTMKKIFQNFYIEDPSDLFLSLLKTENWGYLYQITELRKDISQKKNYYTCLLQIALDQNAIHAIEYLAPYSKTLAMRHLSRAASEKNWRLIDALLNNKSNIALEQECCDFYENTLNAHSNDALNFKEIIVNEIRQKFNLHNTKKNAACNAALHTLLLLIVSCINIISTPEEIQSILHCWRNAPNYQNGKHNIDAILGVEKWNPYQFPACMPPLQKFVSELRHLITQKQSLFAVDFVLTAETNEH
ncbi:MAG: hypothetical protein NTZ67_09200 [Gammaproteobacteria bacterium]|nr:hypothetical protein [Gammaproteobacteria bacterium]